MDSANTSQTIELLKIVVPGILGALSAIGAQAVANAFSNRRHSEEMRQKEKQLQLQFLAPHAQRRLAAYETVYELMQKAIEENSMSLRDYEAVRPMLLYIETGVKESVVNSLARLVSATTSGDHKKLQEAVHAVKQAQGALESRSGVSVVNSGITILLADIERKGKGT
jgi:hypothetical protein